VLHTLAAFAAVADVVQTWVVVAPDDDFFDRKPKACLALARVVRCGGVTRSNSVANGLHALLSGDALPTDWVLVHDAARPCITQSDVEYLINELQDHPVGGILGLASHDTLKSVDDNLAISDTVDRSKIWRAFTPQMFRYAALKHALQEAADKGWIMTDDASAMELQGMQPKIIAGRADNLKITRPEDLALAQFYLEQQ
jgi:2-C-methyl-D-erythritol 4-phosphate cytidylyltransferase